MTLARGLLRSSAFILGMCVLVADVHPEGTRISPDRDTSPESSTAGVRSGQSFYSQTDGSANYFWDVNGNAACELMIFGEADGDNFASHITTADLNNDDTLDLIVTAQLTGVGNVGSVYVFFGGANFIGDSIVASSADITIEGIDTDDRLGFAVTSGDYNGDTIPDLAVSAAWGDGAGNSMNGAGEVYLFFGPLVLPFYSAAQADVFVWGPNTTGGSKDTQIGSALASGDINGDGIDDIVMDFYANEVPLAFRSDAPGFYVLYGRTSWLTDYFMDTDYDVFAWGTTSLDGAYESPPGSGSTYLSTRVVACGDINCDTYDDILILFPGGDGLGDVAQEAGEAHIVFGGVSVPSQIELDGTLPSAYSLADIHIYGMDAWDRPQTISAVDLTNDGCDDVVIGVRYGDGPDNLRTDAGEVHIFKGGAIPDTAFIQKDSSDVVIYNRDSIDLVEDISPAQLDGDPQNELLMSAFGADGPDNSRLNAGEIHVFMAPELLAPVVDLANTTRDAAIFGPEPGARLGVFPLAAGDLTKDGIDEIYGAMTVGTDPSGFSTGKLAVIDGATFLTGDADGDAVDDNCDNCDKYNPSQLNTPDGDGIADACDNCPLVNNPDQADFDFDGIGDACDPDTMDFSTVPQDSADYAFVRSADLDRDNNADIIYTGLSDTGLFVRYGSSTGDLDAPVSYLDVVAAAIATEFINSDTLEDIVARTVDSLFILLNQGSRSFSAVAISLPVPPTSPFARPLVGDLPAVATGFLNDDDFADLVVTPNLVIYGDGLGGALSTQTIATFQGVAVCDVNEDSHDDLVLVESDSVKAYYRDLSGTFVQLSSAFIGVPAPDVTPKIVNTDFNLDALADYATLVTLADSAASSRLSVFIGDGLGGAANRVDIYIPGKAFDLATADFNKDAHPDLAVSNSTTGQIEIYLGDGTGLFDGPFVVDLQAGTDIPTVLTAVDLDRDGNADFVSGITGGGDVFLSTNDGSDEPVIADEMFVTAFTNATVTVHNPYDHVISPEVRTVAGSDYRRLDYNGDGFRDEQTMDYNVIHGTYVVSIDFRDDYDGPEQGVNAAIGINGSQKAVIAQDLKLSVKRSPDAAGSVTFHFPLEAVPTVSPAYGAEYKGLQPTFDWSLDLDTVGVLTYDFQLDIHPEFPAPRLEVLDLLEPRYTPTSELGSDSVFYWRYRVQRTPGVWDEWSYEFAVLVSGGCCIGITGNVNCDESETVDVSDLSMLVNNLFVTFQPLCCKSEANINADPDCTVDVSDLSLLVNHLFVTFEPLPPCGPVCD